jgi:hypothetical protein
MVPSRLSAPPRVTGFALALAAVTAATLVVYWARRELPLSIRPRRALQSTISSLPPAQERMFGSPLRRIRLDDGTPEFEPEAYARRVHLCDHGPERRRVQSSTARVCGARICRFQWLPSTCSKHMTARLRHLMRPVYRCLCS